MKNNTKLKVATALLAGGLVVACGIEYGKYSNSYEAQIKKEISNMSEAQLKDKIEDCDKALNSLQKTIDSKETNPEKRFEARIAYKDIYARREQYKQQLEKKSKQETKIIHFFQSKGK